MEKTIYLFVRDDGDFGAMTFEDNYNPQKIYEEMVAEGVTEKEVVNPEYEDETITVEIKEFGAVDPEFEIFVFDVFCDYDVLKAVNIYQVEPIK